MTNNSTRWREKCAKESSPPPAPSRQPSHSLAKITDGHDEMVPILLTFISCSSKPHYAALNVSSGTTKVIGLPRMSRSLTARASKCHYYVFALSLSLSTDEAITEGRDWTPYPQTLLAPTTISGGHKGDELGFEVLFLRSFYKCLVRLSVGSIKLPMKGSTTSTKVLANVGVRVTL